MPPDPLDVLISEARASYTLLQGILGPCILYILLSLQLSVPICIYTCHIPPPAIANSKIESTRENVILSVS